MSMSFRKLLKTGRNSRKPPGAGKNTATPGKEIEQYLSKNLQLYKISRNKRMSFFKNIFGTVSPSATSSTNYYEDRMDSKKVKYDPKSRVRARWDLLMGCFIMYTCGILPLRVAFGDNEFGFFSMMDLLIDCGFMVDIYINFNTGYDDGGLIIMDPTFVRQKYMKTWFLFDLVSSFPFDLLLLFSSTSNDNYLYFRLPKLLRIFRLPRLFRYLKRWQDVLPINSAALRTAKLVFLILAFAHLNACLQFLVAELEGFPDDGWVARVQVTDAPTLAQYLHALFRALPQMLCIGYGEEPPKTQLEIWIIICSMMSGASFYIVLIGIMSSLMLSMDRSGAKYREQMEIWTEYFAYARIPQKLRNRVIKYYKHRWYTKKYFDEISLVSELSLALQNDISMHICKDLVQKVPIFKACRPVVMASLVPALRPVTLIPNELIYRTGEIANEMFFILHGDIAIESSSGEVFTTLSSGSYFGEFPLIYDRKLSRTAHARAITHVELYSLQRKKFDVICQVYPEFLELMRSIADARTMIFKAQNELMQSDENRDGGAIEDDLKDGASGDDKKERKASIADIDIKVSDSYLYSAQTKRNDLPAIMHESRSERVIFNPSTMRKAEWKSGMKGFFNRLTSKKSSKPSTPRQPTQFPDRSKKKASIQMSSDAMADLNKEEWFQKLSKAIEKSMEADQDIVTEPRERGYSQEDKDKEKDPGGNASNEDNAEKKDENNKK